MAGTESFLLVSKRTCGSDDLSITLVEIQAGGVQAMHSHQPEQVYYILEGSGLMSVDGEDRIVGPGDCVYIPSNAHMAW